jgi:hypothetical protein
MQHIKSGGYSGVRQSSVPQPKEALADVGTAVNPVASTAPSTTGSVASAKSVLDVFII